MRARLPRTPWLIATITLAVASITGGVVLARAIERIDDHRFQLSANELIGDIESQLDGYTLLYTYLPVVGPSSPGSGVGVQPAGQPGGSEAPGVSLPLAGFSGIVMFDPATRGFTGLPAVVELAEQLDVSSLESLAAEALEQSGMVHAPPAMLGEAAYLATAVPVDESVYLAFVDVRDLVTGANATESGNIDFRVVDTTSGAVLAEVGAAARATRQELISWFGRPLRIEMSPGPELPTSNGQLAGISAASLGVIVALLLFALGVAARRTAEEQQRQLALALETVEDKDRFLASVSHELRTPLTVVQGMSSELADRAADFDDLERAEIIAAIAEQSTEMAFLIEDLLVAARSQTDTINVKRESIDVTDHVHLVRDTLLRSVDRSIDLSLADSGPFRAMGDALRFRQVVRNLLTNAFRYGGHNVGVEVRRAGRSIETIVWDDGEGVAPHLRDTIFTAYGRAHNSYSQPNSVGLGLTVARDLVQRMGGTITYDREGGRTLFTVTLDEAAGGEHPDQVERLAAPNLV